MKPKSFSDLDDSAHVDVKVVAELHGTSPATIWRRVARGELPAPVRFSSRCTRWRVSEIRAALAAHQGDTKAGQS